MSSGKLFTGLILLAVFNIGCTDEDALPSNVINDAGGLVVELEWTTGGTTSQSVEDVDLDLELIWNSSVVDESINIDAYEKVTVKPVYRDDSYTINIYYADGVIDVPYSLFIYGVADGTNILKYNGELRSSDSGADVSVLTIEKNGSEYKIIE